MRFHYFLTPCLRVSQNRVNFTAFIPSGLIRGAAASLCLLLPAQGMAASEPHQNIVHAVRDFVLPQVEHSRDQVKIQVGPLDPRLRVAACQTGLQTFFPAGSRALGNTTVGVRCRGVHPWLIYIPVSVKVYQRVLVAARPLPRGTTLRRDDFKLEERDLSQLGSGYLTSPQEAVGRVLQRPLALGIVVSPKNVAAAELVERGQRITILAQAGSLQVRMAGKALMAGAAGERIRVQNLTSKRIVEGVVTAAGVVKVRL
jgi:flagella basal body P-ring formation protein FlgA